MRWLPNPGIVLTQAKRYEEAVVAGARPWAPDGRPPLGIGVLEHTPQLFARGSFTQNNTELLGPLARSRLPRGQLARLELTGDRRGAIGRHTQVPQPPKLLERGRVCRFRGDLNSCKRLERSEDVSVFVPVGRGIGKALAAVPTFTIDIDELRAA